MDGRDPEGRRLPICIDSTSNGEFEPIALTARNERGNRLAQQHAGDLARRKGLGRRAFLMSACGAASTLLAINKVNAEAGLTGGWFDIPADAAFEEAAAESVLNGEEFIFDVQGHYVNPEGAWLGRVSQHARPFSWVPNPCVRAAGTETREYLECLRAEEFIKDVFLDSDTDMMVLSFVPSSRDDEPVTIEEADQTRRIVEAMEGDHRLMLHGRVNPNQPGDLEDMSRLADNFPISAWKTYTQWGPSGHGFYLTDDVGERFIAEARRLGVRNIAIHKGLPFGRRSYEHSLCTDIGPAAKRHPDINFIVYHSGFEPRVRETAFVNDGKEAGIDVLVRSLRDSGVTQNSNVYAELGSTWRFLMRDPEQAAHVVGKLLLACGEDNVLWGTDSIWYGSPQDQIQAFRTFQIADSLREAHGYPELTPQLRAKIFGLNAARPYGIGPDEVRKRAGARDAIAQRRQAYAVQPDPSFTTYGPRNRREFLTFKRLGG